MRIYCYGRPANYRSALADLNATYYAQRASAGLLITEATQISAQAQGYQDTPGLYTRAQIDAWRKVTDAVHAKGGKIFVQLWHLQLYGLRQKPL